MNMPSCSGGVALLASHFTSGELFSRLGLFISVFGLLSSTVYLGMVIAAAGRYRWRASEQQLAADATPSAALPPITVLKPVHGLEPKLAENLASFFEQDYPDFEVVIGARDQSNAALKVAAEVCAKYPHIPSRIVLSGPPMFPNAKVFSLAKMIEGSTNPIFVISDSDILVSRTCLRNLVWPLLEKDTGLVTCIYQGIPTGDLASLLEALGMSVELPSGVLVADMMEGMRFALGAAMAVKRDALEAIGGIQSTANFYSDDFVLGNRVWAAGYKVALSHYQPGHVLMPRTWSQSLADQLRWMKSTRYSRPAGHVGSGLTYAVPFGLLGLISATAAGHPLLGWCLLAFSWANRVLQSLVVGWGVIRDPRTLKFCWLYPLRDLLGFVAWLGSFTSRGFQWRGETYLFGEEGRITPKLRPEATPTAEPRPH
jgi:ceramide glucosyltransferase